MIGETLSFHAKVVILDFDGVVVESVGIKDQAFYELYKDTGHIDEIMAYHLAHNATIRFDKFRHISEHILQRPYTAEDEARLSQQFADLVFQKIVACPYVPGALEFLKTFQGRAPLYLVSFSPREELDRILDQRGLTDYFTRVYSADWKKKDAIDDILSANAIRPLDAVFIGDSHEDYLAAQETGVRFIGRDSGKSFKGANIPMEKSLTAIGRWITCEPHD